MSAVQKSSLKCKDLMDDGTQILQTTILEAAAILQQSSSDTHKHIALLLKQDEGEQTTRMAAALLANAVSFHATLSSLHGMPPLQELTTPAGRYSKSKIANAWRRMYISVHYLPIFYLAREILKQLRTGIANKTIAVLVKGAQELEHIGVTAQHNSVHVLLQKLIADRKFLAAFYTMPSSAALLTELAFPKLKVDWANLKQIKKLRIADFACGTGALLNAARTCVLDRHAQKGDELHALLMERILTGADILPAVTHLTSSILSSSSPATKLSRTRIFTLPYAGPDTALGALDLVKQEAITPVYKTKRGQTTRPYARPP